MPCELSHTYPGYIDEGSFLEEGVGGNKGGQKKKGGQLRTLVLHCSFPHEMAKLCEVHRGCVWRESATGTICCQLIKLAFVISQKGVVVGECCVQGKMENEENLLHAF